LPQRRAVLRPFFHFACYNTLMITKFHIPTKIICGAGSFKLLGSEAARLGKRALLVTGKSSARQTGLLDRAAADLLRHGVEVTIYDRVEPNPRSDTVDEGAGIIREKRLDLVIALGGGSPMDAAKGMVIGAAGGKPIFHYIRTGEKAAGSAPALITVPTVAASGSESNCGAVITEWETHEKCVVSDRCAFPAVSIVDPELTLSVPIRPTAQGGIDIYCHLIEPYITASKPQPLTDGIMETSMKLVADYLPRVLKKLDDLEARSQLSWASTIACSAFAGLGGGDGSMTMHAIEHPLSGLYDIAHGDGLAALLPAYLESLADIRANRLTKLGCAVFGKQDGLAAVKNWLKEIGMDLRLRGLGVEREKLPELAANALKTASWLKEHPKKLDKKAITAIYEEAW
jgi:alcohol dehydrogenase